MKHRSKFTALAAAAAFALGAQSAAAQETIKIGLVMPLTGVLAAVGQQAVAGAKLFVKMNGDTVAGKKIELLIKDDASVPDNSRRLAQEFIVNDKVAVVGAGLTPNALAIAPLSTQAKIPTVIMISGTSFVVERSPYMVRTSWTLGQQAKVMAEWAAKNGSKKVVSVQSDWAPGDEAAAVFIETFKAAGGQILDNLKIPLQNPDFAPFLQRARDMNPDTLFVFVPAGQAGVFARQFIERGFDKAGIKLIGTGDITDDDDLPNMGDAMIGTVTAGFFSPNQKTPLAKAYAEAFAKDNPGRRPNFVSVSGYDGMRLIYEALKKTNGNTNGDAIMEAMKGLKWESPRGSIMIDPETRDVVHDIYIRKVEKVDGQLWNVEFDKVPDVKDPGHGKAK